MNKIHIGFLHPGAMGISLAVTAQNTGHTAYWVSADRSSDTQERAEKHSLVETKALYELCDKCSTIISVCPPHAAVMVAEKVLACSFNGVYVDVNAISPQRAKHIAGLMKHAGVKFVDGGIIGGPAWTPGMTWLYLSGPHADQVAECFAEGPLGTEVIGDEIGKASALKICFAANTKGTTALLCAILAAAEKLGVRKELEKQWSRHGSEFAQNTRKRIVNVTAKAWRFAGEMEEIARTFESVGLPGAFHKAAYDIYKRIAKFKGSDTTPPLEDVLDALLNPDEK
jgi:3-hydroxyisobutyrate dehydrogenase-like beta-hydroxyacid dehydrogenase